MLELAVSAVITVSSALLLGFWCWYAYRLIGVPDGSKEAAPISSDRDYFDSGAL
jgi:hypothetical protein